MKKIIILIFLSLCFISHGFAEKNYDNIENEMFLYRITDFLENPFLEEKVPREYFLNYNDFIHYFSNSKFDIENIYSNDGTLQTAQKIKINFNGIIYHYWRNIGKLENVFLIMIEILPTEFNLLRYNIKAGMKENDIVRIFGDNYRRNTFDSNYEICYDGDRLRISEQVNFLFDYNNNLIEVIIHEY